MGCSFMHGGVGRMRVGPLVQRHVQRFVQRLYRAGQYRCHKQRRYEQPKQQDERRAGQQHGWNRYGQRIG